MNHMTFEKYDFVKEGIACEATDFAGILKILVNEGYITMEHLYDVMSKMDTIVINNVAMTSKEYSVYLGYNREGQAIKAIKAIRQNHFDLGLKEAVDINNEIKNRISIKPYGC